MFFIKITTLFSVEEVKFSSELEKIKIQLMQIPEFQ